MRTAVHSFASLQGHSRSLGQRGAVSLRHAKGLDTPRPVHSGSSAPLADIVVMVAAHWTYHAGEINTILAIRRAEAWEYGEEVEENHILDPRPRRST